MSIISYVRGVGKRDKLAPGNIPIPSINFKNIQNNKRKSTYIQNTNESLTNIEPIFIMTIIFWK